ncbi:MAG: hypothetical protein COV99_06235 [Bacteroidetes bacterium CG12_big_fil_rev_8_21_14_0_65_60_17]|nr:MAG: hypothetical protein COV99_06235 [Bacteroidetes bacterium CG12_big_fil_rev_8_21_14_0_65_60_17]
MTTIEYFLDELMGAAPDGAAPNDLEALASDALDRGLPLTTPEAVVAYVSTADCASRNPQTQLDLVFGKIRRVTTDLFLRLQEVTSDLGIRRPDLHIRLRHSASLLAGHGMDIWPQLARGIARAASDAGAARTSLPVVCWNHARFTDMLPDLAQLFAHSDVRLDYPDPPDPFDLGCLSASLVISRSTSSTRYVISRNMAVCPAVHPETVELAVQSVLTGLSTDAPEVRSAVARTLSRANRHLAHALAAGHAHWKAGPGHLEWRAMPDVDVHQLTRSIPTHLGWPVHQGTPGHLTVRPDTTPDELEDGLARSLSHPGYVVVSDAKAT